MSAKISVIIPAYNAQDELIVALENLAKQTLQDIEVIVINDGSTDDTAASAKEFENTFQTFQYIYQENSGVSAARNAGLDAATGEFIAFLDADDLLTPNSLEDLYHRATEKNADLVIGRIESVTNLGSRTTHSSSEKLAQKDKIDPFDTDLLWCFLIGNKLYRRSLIEEYHLRFPDTSFSEDGVFFMQFIYKTATENIYGCETSLYQYLIKLGASSSSVSRNMSIKNVQDCITSYQMIYDMAANSPALFERDETFKNAYLEEHAYKICYVMIAQFYRRFWELSDGALKMVVSNFNVWKEKINKDQFAVLSKFNHELDLNHLVDSHKEMAKQPLVSIVVKDNQASIPENQTFFYSLFHQSMPAIQLITSQNMVNKGNVPEDLLSSENLTILPKTNKTHLKGAILAPNVIYFKKPTLIAEGAVRAIHRSEKSHIFSGKLFSPIAKFAIGMLGRR